MPDRPEVRDRKKRDWARRAPYSALQHALQADLSFAAQFAAGARGGFRTVVVVAGFHPVVAPRVVAGTGKTRPYIAIQPRRESALT